MNDNNIRLLVDEIISNINECRDNGTPYYYHVTRVHTSEDVNQVMKILYSHGNISKSEVKLISHAHMKSMRGRNIFNTTLTFEILDKW